MFLYYIENFKSPVYRATYLNFNKSVKDWSVVYIAVQQRSSHDDAGTILLVNLHLNPVM